MSISGALRAQTSPGLPADAHDAGFWGAKMGMGGTTARWCTNSRCPHLAQPLNKEPAGSGILTRRSCQRAPCAFAGEAYRTNAVPVTKSKQMSAEIWKRGFPDRMRDSVGSACHGSASVRACCVTAISRYISTSIFVLPAAVIHPSAATTLLLDSLLRYCVSSDSMKACTDPTGAV